MSSLIDVLSYTAIGLSSTKLSSVDHLPREVRKPSLKLLSKLILIVLLTGLPALAELPYAKHGWSREEAAAHLLSRFSYGARPGEVERVASMGLQNWLEEQLRASVPETQLPEKLSSLAPAYWMDNRKIATTYLRPGRVRKMAERAGIKRGKDPESRAAYRAFMKERGLRPFRELDQTLFRQKLYHVRYSENALREVMTDFWFNHFNVAVSNGRAKPFLLSYERDVIRPHSLGNFRTLLGATAKHPAMLLYLDNANSSAGKNAVTTAESRMTMRPMQRERFTKRLAKRKKGLNENYARELMELHTLGVDGGYTQNDVVEVARAFTGWTLNRPRKKPLTEMQKQRMERMGVVSEGDFRFAAQIHDAEPKQILHQDFPAGGGQEEGERVLDILSDHHSTAHHIAKKLAIRFITDDPSDKDVRAIAAAFKSSRGDLKTTLRVLARTDGFWKRSNRHSKVKSPLELLVSANRILGGDLEGSRQVYGWLAKMGQPLYNYQAPTGFPDRADFWVSSATVVNRVNFCLQAAVGKVPGFQYAPPEEANLTAQMSSFLPYQDNRKTLKSVREMLSTSQNFQFKANNRFQVRPNLGVPPRALNIKSSRFNPKQKKSATSIGIILGTPAFQRR